MINPSLSFLLLIGEDGALLLPPQQVPDIDPVFAGAHTELEAESILNAIKSAPYVPVLILYDCGDISFQQERLPKLSFFDRSKLIARRLRLTYPDAAYRGFLLHDERSALLTAVSETKPLAFWEDLLDKLPNASGLLCALPLESASIVTQLWPAAKGEWVIFLSFQKTGGIRQIVTHNGMFVFTRLTPPLSPGTSLGYMAASLGIEIKATRDYLSRMGLEHDTPLHLVGLLPKATHGTMSATPMDVASRHFFTPQDAAVKLKLPYAPEEDESDGDLVHALWLGTRMQAALPMLKDSKRRDYQRVRLHKTGMSFAIVLALLAGILLGIGSLDLMKKQSEIFELENDIARIESDFLKLQKQMATRTEPLDQLRKAVERQRLFEPEPPAFLAPLLLIAETVGDEFRLDALSWEAPVLNFDLRKTAKDGTQSETVINPAEARAFFLDVEKNLNQALERAAPGSRVERTSPFPGLSENTALTSEDKAGTPQAPVASFKLEWRQP